MAAIVALRLRLPRLLEQSSLDVLLASLTTARAPQLRATPDVKDLLLSAERWVGRIPWVPNTCLYRAIARYASLRAAGVEAHFVMAIDANDRRHDGHAWVELFGKPFEENEDLSRYTVTFRHPPPRHAEQP